MLQTPPYRRDIQRQDEDDDEGEVPGDEHAHRHQQVVLGEVAVTVQEERREQERKANLRYQGTDCHVRRSTRSGEITVPANCHERCNVASTFGKVQGTTDKEKANELMRTYAYLTAEQSRR